MRCIDCSYFKRIYGTHFCLRNKKHKRIKLGDELKDVPCFKVESIDEIIEKYYPQHIKYIKRKEKII